MEDNIEVRRAEPADAEGIVACFRRCYADTYPTSLFYDAEALAEAIHARQRECIIAVTSSETPVVAGHMANTVHSAERVTAELGNTVVDPAFRGQRLMGRLGAALSQWCQQQGYTGYVHYPTTAHPVMQQASVAGRGRDARW